MSLSTSKKHPQYWHGAVEECVSSWIALKTKPVDIVQCSLVVNMYAYCKYAVVHYAALLFWFVIHFINCLHILLVRHDCLLVTRKC